MKNEKQFDCVKMMREIRDRLSQEFANMSYEEQKRYIRERLSAKPQTTQDVKRDVPVVQKLVQSFLRAVADKSGGLAHSISSNSATSPSRRW